MNSQSSSTPGVTAERAVVRAIAVTWLAVFLFFILCFGSVRQLQPGAFAGLALSGLLYCAFFDRKEYFAMVRSQGLLLFAALLVVVAISVAGWMLHLRVPDRLGPPLPAQIGLLLCLTPLAVILKDRKRLQIATVVFAGISLLHAFALPIEAMTGVMLDAQGEDLLPRNLGPLQYQARGLAWQVYYFPGVFLSLFYLAAGAVGEEGVFGDWQMGPRTWLFGSIVWTAAVACLQSRSAFAGALAASVLGWLMVARARAAYLWLVGVGVVTVGLALFWYMFAENKSSPGLRIAYLALYLQRSFDVEWLWTGRGYTEWPDPTMLVPGYQHLHHSHNDLVQVFFTWGLPSLLAYLLFWLALLRLVARFWRQGRHWPVLTLVAVGPSLTTDLGLHNVEKTASIALLAAMCMALAERTARPAAAAAGVAVRP